MVLLSLKSIIKRLDQHLEFVHNRIITKGLLKYLNTPYSFPVLTNQEKDLVIYDLACVESIGNNIFEGSYSEKTQKRLSKDVLSQLNQSNSETKLLHSPQKRSLIVKQELKSS
jgi:modification methylase